MRIPACRAARFESQLSGSTTARTAGSHPPDEPSVGQMICCCFAVVETGGQQRPLWSDPRSFADLCTWHCLYLHLCTNPFLSPHLTPILSRTQTLIHIYVLWEYMFVSFKDIQSLPGPLGQVVDGTQNANSHNDVGGARKGKSSRSCLKASCLKDTLPVRSS